MPYHSVRINWFTCFIKHCSWLLLLFAMPCYAQIAKVNDLQLKLKQSLPDTARLNTLSKLTEAYTSVDPEKKFYYSVILKKFAEKLHDEKAIADAYLSMGVSYGVRGDKMDSALYYFSLAYNQSSKINYLKVMGKSLSDMGYAYDHLDEKSEAIKYYFQALIVLKKAKFTRGVNQCLINIGSIYYDLQQYKLAQTYFEQCLKSYVDTKDEAGIGYGLFVVGGCYQALGQVNKAMDYLNRSLAIRLKLDDVNGIALVRKDIGRTYLKSKQYDLAIASLDTALKTVRGLKNQYEEGAILLDLADVYLGKKDYDKVITCMMQSLSIFRSIKSKSSVSESLQRLVSAYEGKHDIAKAFKYQSEYVTTQHLMLVEKELKDVSLTEVNRMRAENASLAQDNQIIAQKNTSILTKLDQYSNTIVTTSVILVFTILLLLILYRRNLEKQATNKQLLQQKEEIAEINKELEMLNEELNTQMELTAAQNAELEKLNHIKNKFFSIISHDLRGPLVTLQSLFSAYRGGNLNKEEFSMLFIKLEDTILSTGAFLDNLLEWSKNQLEGLVVKPENFNISDCFAENVHLFETKIGLKNLTVTNLAINPVIVYADRNMVNLVIRNLLSNSLKFCSPGDKISLNAGQKDNRVIINISDTGPGIAASDMDKLFSLEHALSTGTQGEKGNNLGLILCREMITQNNGKIWFDTKQGEGTTFWIELPGELTT